jgi:hypothetical protein
MCVSVCVCVLSVMIKVGDYGDCVRVGDGVGDVGRV